MYILVLPNVGAQQRFPHCVLKVVCGLSLKVFRTSSCLPSAFGKQHLFQNPLSWLKKSQKGTGIPAEHTAGVLERLVECVLCSELGCFPVRGMAGTQK